ncbi:MAG: hypothetical protein E7069_13170 [Bacteroidales bacterium]|jgi:cell division protein FtsN|nr:hypothetical protein [Bacteroidales bacterium]
MDKYIQELISTESRVIVPGFGAFTMERNVEGKVDIAFNKWLNFDDHILSEYVAQKSGVSREEAEEQIAEFAKKLNNQLDTEKHVSIAGVGEFEKTDTGNVKFQPDSDAVSSVVGENASETITIAHDEAEASTDEETSTVEENAEPAAVTIDVANEEKKPEVAPASINVNNTTNVYNQKQSNKTWLWIIIIVLLFLALAWVLLFVVNKDNVVYKYFYPETTEVVEQPVAEPDTTVVSEPVQEPQEKNTLSRRYNIVVGSYKDRPSAEKKVENLHERGFKDAFVADYTNEHGHWFIAVIEEHSTLVEAETRQEYIVDNYRIESWITNGGE